jgi:hypothetical protein
VQKKLATTAHFNQLRTVSLSLWLQRIWAETHPYNIVKAICKKRVLDEGQKRKLMIKEKGKVLCKQASKQGMAGAIHCSAFENILRRDDTSGTISSHAFREFFLEEVYHFGNETHSCFPFRKRFQAGNRSPRKNYGKHHEPLETGAFFNLSNKN